MRVYPEHKITESLRSRGRMVLDGTQGRLVDLSAVTTNRPAWIPRVDGRIPALGQIRYEQDEARRLTRVRYNITEWTNGLLIRRPR